MTVCIATPPACRPQPPASRVRRGFTLTELLVVITIIAVLAALASVAVVRALDTAKQTRQKTEVDGLDAAFKAYKEKYGSYPPCDLSNINAVRAHVARAFPRYNISNLANDLKLAVDNSVFRPDQALVFWLSGFSPDITNPFVTPTGAQIINGAVPNPTTIVQRTAFFEFDKARLSQITSVPTPPAGTATGFSYFPQGIKTDVNGAPYLYWSAGPNTTTVSGMKTTTINTFGQVVVDTMPTPPTATVTPNLFNASANRHFTANASTASPYWYDSGNTTVTDPNETWSNADSFQIIAPGGDGKYGNDTGTLVRLYPTGTNYDLSADLADDDNVTNFCPRARLGDAKP
jgi:prepilin-type N-terminal cleavage/methylation domain-containing protein